MFEETDVPGVPADLVVLKNGRCSWWGDRLHTCVCVDRCEIGRSAWAYLLAFTQQAERAGTLWIVELDHCSLTGLGVGCLADLAMMRGMRAINIESVMLPDLAASMHRLVDAIGDPRCALGRLVFSSRGYPLAGMINKLAKVAATGCKLQLLWLGGDIADDDLCALRRLHAAMQSNYTLEFVYVHNMGTGEMQVDPARLFDRRPNPIAARTDTMMYKQRIMTGFSVYIQFVARPSRHVSGEPREKKIYRERYPVPLMTTPQPLSRIWPAEKFLVDSIPRAALPSGVRICPAEFPLDMEQICAYAVQVAPDAEFVVIG
jgi:hypothetical protein